MRPSDAGGDLFAGLATALLKEEALPELGADRTGVEELAALLRESPDAAFPLLKGGLSQAAAELARAEGLERQPEARLALVVDQLEELFISTPAGADREKFVEALRALVASGRVWVLATLRSDFYPRSTELPALVELKEGSGQYDLLPPTAGEIGQMIRRPARLAGLSFEEREATGARLDDTLRDAAAQNPEALPLLQFTLEELYSARSDQEELTFAAYEELGGVGGALAQRAEAAFGSLKPEVQTALPSVLSRLVTVGADAGAGATRQRALLEAFPEAGPERALVDRFVEARLCVTDRDEQGRAVVSVAHEALLEHWPRLREWLEHNRELLRMRERLDAAAQQWEAEGRPVSYLLASPQRLAEAEELEGAEGIELPAREHAFLQASLARGRRTRWLKRAAVAALAVLTVAAATGAWVATVKRQEAEVARGESEAVTDFLSDMLASVDPEELGREVLVKDVLDQASEKIDELEDQPLIQARLMDTMGGVYESLGLFTEAEALLEKSWSVRSEALGPDDPLVAQSLHQLGVVNLDRGHYERARELLQKALSIRESTLGPEHPSVGNTLNSLANISLLNGELEAAQPLYERAVTVHEKSQNFDRMATCLGNLGVLFVERGDYEAAQATYERAVSILEKEHGPTHPSLSATLNNLGTLAMIRGDRRAARVFLERVISINERALGPDHPELAQTMENLAIVLEAEADFDQAERLHRRALEIKTKALGGDHPDLAFSFGNLGVHYHTIGDLKRARSLFERALIIRERSLEPDHPYLSISLVNLADLLRDLGRLEDARSLFERALAISEEALGEDHPDTARVLAAYATLLSEAGDHGSAKALFERALSVQEEKLGPQHPEVAETLVGMAALLGETGDLVEAEQLFRRALTIQEEDYGNDHPRVAFALTGLAKVLCDMGTMEEAEPLLERALKVQDENLGPDSFHLAETLEAYGQLLRSTDRAERAEDLEARARQIRDQQTQEEGVS
jgi:tetratricopeptide (TPR) repeat protein